MEKPAEVLEKIRKIMTHKERVKPKEDVQTENPPSVTSGLKLKATQSRKRTRPSKASPTSRKVVIEPSAMPIGIVADESILPLSRQRSRRANVTGGPSLFDRLSVPKQGPVVSIRARKALEAESQSADTKEILVKTKKILTDAQIGAGKPHRSQTEPTTTVTSDFAAQTVPGSPVKGGSAKKGKVDKDKKVDKKYNATVDMRGFFNDEITVEVEGTRILKISGMHSVDASNSSRKAIEVIQLPSHVTLDNLRVGRLSDGFLLIEEYDPLKI